MTAKIHRLTGANMDIDLATPVGQISWEQAACPWNAAEQGTAANSTVAHHCAVKNISICPYFCGIEYLDILLCCYPEKNPYRKAE